MKAHFPSKANGSAWQPAAPAPVARAFVWLALVASGIGLRLALQELPNFAPVAAMALFAGYFFRARTVALSVPIVVMLSTDLVIGGYAWHMMVLVYAMLALPVALRPVLRRLFRVERGQAGPAALCLVGLMGCSLGCSLLHFLVTNLGVWLTFSMYAKTWPGLVQCYLQALPFFRYTLAGDALFGLALFGGYALVMACLPRAEHQAARVQLEAQ